MPSSKDDSCFLIDSDGTITCTICNVKVKGKKNLQSAMGKHLADKAHKKIVKKGGADSGGGKPKKKTLAQKLAQLSLTKSKKKDKKKDKKMDKNGKKCKGSSSRRPDGGSLFVSRLTNADLVALAHLVPARLTAEERRLLRLVEGALDISEYTDRVDVSSNMMGYSSYYSSRTHGGNKSAVIIDQLKEILRLCTALELATNFKHGKELGRGRITDDAHFYGHMLEVARRYKIQNPDKLRSTYGKLMFALMDASLPKVKAYLGCRLYTRIQCVPELLEDYGAAGEELLADSELLAATRPVVFTSQALGQPAAPAAAAAAAATATATATATAGGPAAACPELPAPAIPDDGTGAGGGGGASSSSSSDDDGEGEVAGDGEEGAAGEGESDGEGRQGAAAAATTPGAAAAASGQADPRVAKREAVASITRRYTAKAIPEPVISRCLASLDDAVSSVVANAEPVERLLQLLVQRFSPSDPDMGGVGSLAISHGRGGSRLSHSHDTQFFFVLQTLCLWRRIQQNMLRLWHAADQDLASGSQSYALRNTGQGMNRVQGASAVSSEMQRILSDVKREVRDWRSATGHEHTARSTVGYGRGWVGLSVVHLGDRDVPNALVFIDKYSQVPRIVAPIVATLERTRQEVDRDPTGAFATFVRREFGGRHDDGVTVVQNLILRDYCRHGFNGSGDDGGSCIDGRLTSSWNWCANLHKKVYYPVFLMAGDFAGFDGDWRS